MTKGKRGHPSDAGPSSQPFFPPPVIGESIPLPFGMGGLGAGGGGSQGNGRGAVPPGGQILPVAKLPRDFDGVPLDGSQYLGMVRREAGETKLPGDAARRKDAQGKKRAAATKDDSEELSYYDEVDGMDEHEDEAWESDESDDSDRAYIARPLAASALEMRQRAEAEGDASLGMPSREWREEFVRKFENMREAMSNAPIGPITNPNIGKLPPLNSRGGWFRFVHGYASPSTPMNQRGQAGDDQEAAAEEEENGEEAAGGVQQMGRAKVTQGLRMPSASLLRRFNTDHILALLSHMPYWLPQPLTKASHVADPQAPLPPSISSHHSLWLFSLLSVLDGRLTSDEISELRTLARSAIACVVLRRTLASSSSSSSVPTGQTEAQVQPSTEGQEAEAEGCEEGEMGAWMVIAAVAGIWHQADLWDDARRDLRSVAAAQSSSAPT